MVCYALSAARDIATLIISGRLFDSFCVFIQAIPFAAFVAVSVLHLAQVRKEQRNVLRIATLSEVTLA